MVLFGGPYKPVARDKLPFGSPPLDGLCALYFGGNRAILQILSNNVHIIFMASVVETFLMVMYYTRLVGLDMRTP